MTTQPKYLQNTAKAACGTHTVEVQGGQSFEVTIQESFWSHKTGRPTRTRQCWLLTIPGLYNQEEFATIHDLQDAITKYRRMRLMQSGQQEEARPLTPNQAAQLQLQQRIRDIDEEVERIDGELEEYEELLEQSDHTTSRQHYRNRLKLWRAKRAELLKKREGLQGRLDRCRAWAIEDAAVKAQEGTGHLLGVGL